MVIRPELSRLSAAIFESVEGKNTVPCSCCLW
jgi:hypothetical protein